jgi:hypothetical protein
MGRTVTWQGQTYVLDRCVIDCCLQRSESPVSVRKRLRPDRRFLRRSRKATGVGSHCCTNSMPTASPSLCWWCGAVADSGEHKFKRSDLVRAFGNGGWRGETAVAHVTDRILSPQSSRAKSLKFAKTLCHHCNTARSQPFDRAYDQFADHIRGDSIRILDTGVLDWRAIYGDEWMESVAQLIRYWVKHIGCRLSEVGAIIRPELPDFLDGAQELKHIRMGFEIREDIAAVMAHLQDKHDESGHSLWLGPAAGYADQDGRQIVQVSSHIGIDWLRLWYDYDSQDPYASVDFKSVRNVLPRDSSLDLAKATTSCRVCHPELATD